MKGACWILLSLVAATPARAQWEVVYGTPTSHFQVEIQRATVRHSGDTAFVWSRVPMRPATASTNLSMPDSAEYTPESLSYFAIQCKTGQAWLLYEQHKAGPLNFGIPDTVGGRTSKPIKIGPTTQRIMDNVCPT